MIAMAAAAAALAAGPKPVATIAVSARYHSYRDAVVIATLPAGERHARTQYDMMVVNDETGARLPAQTGTLGSTFYVTFVEPEHARGSVSHWSLQPAPRGSGIGDAQVDVRRDAGGVVVRAGGALFCRYGAGMAPNKPVMYPILATDGTPLTRQWPIEQAAGDSRDHPHHRGLWFTHGSVNGIDFWSEGKGTGSTVTRRFVLQSGGSVYGGFDADTDWIAPGGAVIATDTRNVRVYPLPGDQRLMDFVVTVTPQGGPLVFGDTKEGSFGMRVPEWLTLAKGASIVNSAGETGDAVWGRRANWVDYTGTGPHGTYGISMLSHPLNPNSPAPWHARGYGLFAVNPFATGAMRLGAANSGRLTVEPGQVLTLRYRMLFHPGGPDAAGTAVQYGAYANPPECEAHWN